MIVSTNMASFHEGSSGRLGFIIHDPEATKAQSIARPRGCRGRGRRRSQEQSFDEAGSMTSTPQDQNARSPTKRSLDSINEKKKGVSTSISEQSDSNFPFYQAA